MKTTIAILTVLLPALVIAPAMRLSKPVDGLQNDEHALPDITVHGLDKVGQFAAANQGPYQVTSFRHPDCDGSIALLPLYRNAEGSNVLSTLFDNPALRYGVIFNNTIHVEFPQFEFTVYQFREKALRGLPFASPPQHPFAFAESGACELAERVAETI